MPLSFRLIESKGNTLTITHPAVIKILSVGLRCATDLPEASSSQRHLCFSCSSSSQSEIKTNDFRCFVTCGSALSRQVKQTINVECKVRRRHVEAIDQLAEKHAEEFCLIYTWFFV